MNTKILALTILIISVASAQTVTYNATSCAANKTAAFCTVAQANSSASMPVCAAVNFSGNVSNKIVTGNVGYFCLPLVLSSISSITYNATFNISTSAAALNNTAVYTMVPSTCTKYGDSACASGTCCANLKYNTTLAT